MSRPREAPRVGPAGGARVGSTFADSLRKSSAGLCSRLSRKPNCSVGRSALLRASCGETRCADPDHARAAAVIDELGAERSWRR